MRLVGCRQDAESSQPKADKNYYKSAPDPRISTSPQTEPQVSGAISHSVPIGGDIASDVLSGNLLPRTAPESLDEAVAEYKALVNRGRGWPLESDLLYVLRRIEGPNFEYMLHSAVYR